MNNLRIINGKDVDLISPFPMSEIKRLYGWLHCYRTITECDDSPKDVDTYCQLMTEVLSKVVSWGVIDKNQLTNIYTNIPRQNRLHIARCAWGIGRSNYRKRWYSRNAKENF